MVLSIKMDRGSDLSVSSYCFGYLDKKIGTDY